jgi:hypothetical protein
LKTIRSHITYANVMATIAVFIALGGASYAAVKLPAKSVGTKQIKKGAVKTAKLGREAVKAGKIAKGAIVTTRLRNGAVTSEKVADGSLLAQDFAAGQLPAAPQGSAASIDCPAGTSLVVGVCFETSTRAPEITVLAMSDCGDDGRRLPSQSELVSYGRSTFTSQPPAEWAGGLIYNGSEIGAMTVAAWSADQSFVFKASGSEVPYRCVVPPS